MVPGFKKKLGSSKNKIQVFDKVGKDKIAAELTNENKNREDFKRKIHESSHHCNSIPYSRNPSEKKSINSVFIEEFFSFFQAFFGGIKIFFKHCSTLKPQIIGCARAQKIPYGRDYDHGKRVKALVKQRYHEGL